MPQIIAKNFGVESAQEYVDDATDERLNTYLIFARVDTWANDASPNTPYTNTENFVNFWRSAIGGKLITGNDMMTAVPRIDWTANTVYSAYSDKAIDPFGANGNFYVMTDEYNVYKCLGNNGGANSTIKPTYTSYDTTNQEADGYIWKYMLTLGTAARTRFLTDSFIPVRTLIQNDGSLQWFVQGAATDGGINVINLTNAGDGYTNASNVVVTITGDGSLATAIANINVTSQTVTSISVTNPGSGYHYANVSITGGGGANATARAVISPFGGHGSDPANELGASNVIINIRLKGYEDSKLQIGNDFRQIGLVLNPIKYASSDVMGNSTFNQTLVVTTSTGATDYINDEYVFQGSGLSAATFSGKVVRWDNANNILYLNETSGTPTSAGLFGATSGTNRFLVSTVNPEIKAFSGQVLYIENITSITRAADQTEDLKIILKF